MEYPLVDEFFNCYKTYRLPDTLEYISKRLREIRFTEKRNGKEEIKKYIESQTAVIANYYKSNIDINNKDYEIIQKVVAPFEMLANAVNLYMPTYLYSDDEELLEYIDEDYVMVTAQDLFTLDFGCMDKAVEDYGPLESSCYEKIKNLIKYVRDNKILDKIYADSGWRNVNLEELLYTIYDKVEDKSLFSSIEQDWAVEKYLLFTNVKENCTNVKNIKFDKYRPQLNCGKQMRANFSKLIFCKNLMLYFETGLMPDEEGRIDLRINESETRDLLDDFKSLYSKNFDEEQFRTMQSNYILDPEVLATDFSIEAARKVFKGDKMVVGFLISSGDYTELDKKMYLLHMEVADVMNDKSNYEIQFNIVPNGDLTKRIQLIRLDNWQTEQPHKNVANKLSTRTHIHLYNEFDLLRGKTNGNYDIAYNFSGSSTTFNTSLKTFLEILELNPAVQKKIYDITIKSIEQRQNRLKIVENEANTTIESSVPSQEI